MGRVYNFSAGPAVLPEEVLRQAAAEMLDYDGTGMSVMEMSHRSKPFAGIIETAEADLRDLIHIHEGFFGKIHQPACFRKCHYLLVRCQQINIRQIV